MLCDLPMVTAKDVGDPREPGEYQVAGKFFEVRREHIDAWRTWPGKVFRTIRRFRVNDDRSRYVVGAPAEEPAARRADDAAA